MLDDQFWNIGIHSERDAQAAELLDRNRTMRHFADDGNIFNGRTLRNERWPLLALQPLRSVFAIKVTRTAEECQRILLHRLIFKRQPLQIAARVECANPFDQRRSRTDGLLRFSESSA